MPEDQKPKLINIGELFKPENLAKLPKELRDVFSSIKFEFRVDLESVLAEPSVPSLLEQLAFAAASEEDAAYAVVLAADAVDPSLYRSLESSGKERMMKWVLKGYIPSGDTPPELWAVLQRYLAPDEADSPE
jgi:hypothetical protein